RAARRPGTPGAAERAAHPAPRRGRRRPRGPRRRAGAGRGPGVTATAVGLCGLGSAALRAHLPALCRAEETGAAVIAGVCDPDPARSETVVARTRRARAFPDVEALLDGSGCDLLVIASPPSAHIPAITAAARRGVDVLCEKPLGVAEGDVDSHGAPGGETASVELAVGPGTARVGVSYDGRRRRNLVALALPDRGAELRWEDGELRRLRDAVPGRSHPTGALSDRQFVNDL